MTLEQAYAIQRKELLSLKTENAHLKKQAECYPDESEVKDLKKQLRELTARCRKAEECRDRLDSLYQNAQNRCVSLEAKVKFLEVMEAVRPARNLPDLEKLRQENNCLRSENRSLKEQLSQVKNELESLNLAARRLSKKLNTGFENSSLPSSAVPFRKKIPNSRKRSGLKPGAQPHHKGHRREQLVCTCQPEHLPIPPEFNADPDIYPTGKLIKKQLIDIRIHVLVKDFIADEFRNRKTGARLHAQFPAGIVNDVNYGPSLKGFAFLLNNYYNIPVAKTSQCISELTHGSVRLSTGMINSLASEFSSRTEADRQAIFDSLVHADVLYSDATVSNINGSRQAVVLCSDSEHVLYQHFEHKGLSALEASPVKACRSILIHDHDVSYYRYGKAHQECLAHILRYLKGAMETEPALTWHKKMHSLIQKMIHVSKRYSGNIPMQMRDDLVEQYHHILRIADTEYLINPPYKELMDGYNLQKRLREYEDAYLYFLFHPGVDYTNNLSERELRKFKRKQKQAVVFRSETGGQFICDALTILETARLHDQNLYDLVTSVFD